MTTPVTKADLVDALGCFWNAAIGESHRQQEAMPYAAIMATGIAAIAQRLEELDGAVPAAVDTRMAPSAQYAAELLGDPVAWRCKDFADGWIIYQDFKSAAQYQSAAGCFMQPLYALVRKGE